MCFIIFFAKNQLVIKLSIILPMYNSEKYIQSCLDFLVKQDLCIDDYEIIIINDGSSDNREEIVKEYMK